MTHGINRLPVKESIKLSCSTLVPKPGSVPRTPTIFLHGFLGSRKAFISAARQLQRSLSMPCFVPDLRNHGHTKPWVHNMDYDSQANDLRLFINDHGLKRVNLVGFSMGAKVTLDYILRELHKKDSVHVEKLVLIDNAPVNKDIGMEFRQYAKVLKEINDLILLKRFNPKTWEEDIAGKLRQHKLSENLVLYFLALFEKNPLTHHYRMKIPTRLLEEEILKILGEFIDFGDVTTDIETLFIKATNSGFIDEDGLKIIKNTFTNHKIIEYDAFHQDLLSVHRVEIANQVENFLRI